jgi:hypothetical protein
MMDTDASADAAPAATDASAPVDADAQAAAKAKAAQEELAAGRAARAAGRSSARQAHQSALQAGGMKAGGADELDWLRKQQARERELELQELMQDDEAEAGAGGATAAGTAATAAPAGARAAPAAASASAAPSRKSKGGSAASSAPRGSPPPPGTALLDVADVAEEADLPYLDQDIVSRTKHNKRMRVVIKEGQAKQDRYIRRHMAQLAPFLNAKTRRKYEGSAAGGEEGAEDGTVESAAGAAAGGAGEEDAAAVAQQNVKAGQLAHLQSLANPEATAVSLPPTAPAEALADLQDESLPQSKVFIKQPAYILNGEMREYQILGLNWLINRHENVMPGILGDEMGSGTHAAELEQAGAIQ